MGDVFVVSGVLTLKYNCDAAVIPRPRIHLGKAGASTAASALRLELSLAFTLAGELKQIYMPMQINSLGIESVTSQV